MSSLYSFFPLSVSLALLTSTEMSSSVNSLSHRSFFLLCLPSAVVLSILSFLPLSSLTSSSSLSSLFFVLTQDDRLWRPLCVRRWRTLLPYLQHRLMSPREWATADGVECSEEVQGVKRGGTNPTGLEGGREEVDDGPVFPSEGGWKVRYISCEMDLCRSYLSLSELLSHRWQFRFHFPFDDTTRVSYPVFTKSRMSNREDTYDWRWVDRQRGIGELDGEGLAYERRHFLITKAIHRLPGKPRHYWLRSSPTPPLSTPPTTGSNAPTPAPAPRLCPTSALLSSALPPYRYLPGHPFFAPTSLQMEDCRVVRGLQVNNFPPRTITRMSNGGWQMINQYILMIAVHPDSQEEEEEEEEEDEEAEEGEDEDDELGVIGDVGGVHNGGMEGQLDAVLAVGHPRLYYHLHYHHLRRTVGLDDAMHDGRDFLH